MSYKVPELCEEIRVLKEQVKAKDDVMRQVLPILQEFTKDARWAIRITGSPEDWKKLLECFEQALKG